MGTLGDIIKERREVIGISQRTLGTQAAKYREDRPGVVISDTYIKDIEKHGKIPSDEMIFAIARALGLNEAELIAVARQEATSSPSVSQIYQNAFAGTLPPPTTAPPQHAVPVIAYVSAGEPFAWTDGGYPAGQGFDYVDLPVSLPNGLGEKVYAVRVRGDSMAPYLKDGTTLIVKPESYSEVKHGDYVVWKDPDYNAWVKMVLFHNGRIVFRSLNPNYPDIIHNRAEVTMMDRVIIILL